MTGRMVDRSGQVYNEWTILYPAVPYMRNKGGYWMCRCSCGTVTAVSVKNVVRGLSKRCMDCARRVKKNNVVIRWGVHTMNQSDWSRALGLLNQTLSGRINAGWPLRDAMTEGVDPVILSLLIPDQSEDPVLVSDGAEDGRNQ